MRILVCGSRDWTDRGTIFAWLSKLPKAKTTAASEVTIVHGNAKGADLLADDVAKELGFRTEPHDADWDRDGKSAGPKRNARMAATEIARGIAFGPLEKADPSGGTWPDGSPKITKKTGTGDMVSRLLAKGVPVTVIPCPLRGASNAPR